MSKKVATLGTTNRRSRSHSHSDDEERQGFYVGGSERSGQEVIGSPTHHLDEDRVSTFFENARAHGAEILSPAENARYGTHDAVQFGATNIGHRLGDATNPSEAVGGSSERPEQHSVILVMWANGFTVDDGPLRSMDDPANRDFLSAISVGRVPGELLKKYPGKLVNLRMERHKEPYVEKVKLFSGAGQRLGAIVPSVIEDAAMFDKDSPGSSPTPETLKQAQDAINLAVGEKVHQVQIRLANGVKLVGKFNSNHTVQDIRNFIVNAVPDYAFQPFALLTTFPNRVIEIENISLQDAGLLNAIVVTKLV